jgi:hypothetical protein
MAACTATSCSGFRVSTTRDVTRGEYVAVCARLGCFPEPAIEGGMVFLRRAGVGHGGGPHKAARHNFQPVAADARACPWPYVAGREMEKWKGSSDVLVGRGHAATIELRASHGAPAWDMAELRSLAAAWRTLGGVVSDMPRELPSSAYRCPDCCLAVIDGCGLLLGRD